MKYLFDTNVISEFTKPRPDETLVRWASAINPSDAYVSAISIGEIRRGIEMKRIGHEYPPSINRLAQFLHALELTYRGRILAFDQNAAHLWGQITAHCRDNPTDAQIAGIALANDAIVVTRDKGFKQFKDKIANFGIVLQLINPFNETH